MNMTQRTAFAVLLLSAAASAQTQQPASEFVPLSYDTGAVANTGSELEVVVSFPVYLDGAPWMRLFFEEIDLAGDIDAGTASELHITSLLDGHQQRMNAQHVQEWNLSTAYFNGDAVLVELLAYPGTGTNRLVLEKVLMGDDLVLPESQCGNFDDRLPTTEVRAGRVLNIGCTAWIVDSCGCMITAGHCTAFAFSVVQFNVPPSTSTGALVNPGPQDQYTVDPASTQSNGGQGIGNDYAYFGVFDNTNTGLNPFEAQGDMFTVVDPPAFQNGQNIRITGYGVDFDDNTRNQTNQTHVGPRVNAALSTEVEYMTDTEGGNSGSPVIFESTGDAIGVHTHGGCSNTSGNHGTGANHTGLKAFLANPQGVCAGGGGGGGGGTVTKYGEGLGGSNIGDLDSQTAPNAGSPMTFDVTQIPNGTTGFVWMSFTQTSNPFFGGTELADFSSALVKLPITLSGGSTSISFNLPPGAMGLTVFAQAGAFDTTQSQGVALTNGLQLDIG